MWCAFSKSHELLLHLEKVRLPFILPEKRNSKRTSATAEVFIRARESKQFQNRAAKLEMESNSHHCLIGKLRFLSVRNHQATRELQEYMCMHSEEKEWFGFLSEERGVVSVFT